MRVEQLSHLTLLFAVLLALFIVGPALLSGPFGPYALLRSGDILDLLTPLVLIPLYWLLFQHGGASAPGRARAVAFLVLAALWVEGQGMHLAANAIGHLGEDFAGTPAAALVHFIDERLSHFMWHTGLAGLSALLIHREWWSPVSDRPGGPGFEIAAGILYGMTYFLAIVEGATTVLGLPFAVLAVGLLGVRGWRRVCRQPLLVFFFVGYTVATLCFLAWGIAWHGWPEPSAVGIIE